MPSPTAQSPTPLYSLLPKQACSPLWGGTRHAVTRPCRACNQRQGYLQLGPGQETQPPGDKRLKEQVGKDFGAGRQGCPDRRGT